MMKTMLFFVVMLSLPFKAHGRACELKDSTYIYFGNGVLNDFVGAVGSTEALAYKVQSALPPSSSYRFFTSYNHNEAPYIQFLQVFKQKREDFASLIRWTHDPTNAPEWYKESYLELQKNYGNNVYANDPDLLQHIKSYEEALRARNKVVVVAHSQGNLYANQASLRLGSERFGIVAVATPASRVEGGGEYITLKNDRVIQFTRAIYPSTLEGKHENLREDHNYLHHAFVDSYLEGDQTGPTLIANLVAKIGALGLLPCNSEPPPLPPCDNVWCYDEEGNPNASASSVGDPHLRTFDGLAYDFQGAGEYVYVRSQTRDLEIQGRLEPFSEAVSRNRALAAKVNNDRLAFYSSADGIDILINGLPMAFKESSVDLPGGGRLFRSLKEPYFYTTLWPDGSQMRVKRRGPYLEMFVNLAPARKGLISGLLGNFDGNAQNDLVSAEGDVLDPAGMNFHALYKQFGKSWRVQLNNTLFDYFGTENLETFVDENFPPFPTSWSLLAKELNAEQLKAANAACLPLERHSAHRDCLLDSATVGVVKDLEAYFHTAAPKLRVEIPLLPRIIIKSPVQGLVTKGNVLVQGTILDAEQVRALLVSVNDSAPRDFTKALNSGNFVLTLPNELLKPGENFAYIFAEDHMGNRTNARLNIVMNKDAPPAAGSDIVVANDINMFDDNHIGSEFNLAFARNIFNFVPMNPKKAMARTIVFSFGHESKCPSSCRSSLTSLRKTITDAGYRVEDVAPSVGTMLSIPDDAKVLFLWLPLVPYTKEEVQVLKNFAADGGRIVFVGENEAYYGPGVQVENDFLKAMGALMENKGGTVLEGRTTLVATSGSGHQLLHGVPSIQTNRVATIALGPYDYPLFADRTGTHIVVAVAQINVNAEPTLEPRRREPYREAPFIRTWKDSFGFQPAPARTTGRRGTWISKWKS